MRKINAICLLFLLIFIFGCGNNGQLDELQNRVQTLQNHIFSLESEKNQMSSQINNLTEELKKKIDNAAQIKELQNKIQSLQNNISSLSSEKTQMSSQIFNLTEKTRSLFEVIAERDKSILALREEIRLRNESSCENDSDCVLVEAGCPKCPTCREFHIYYPEIIAVNKNKYRCPERTGDSCAACETTFVDFNATRDVYCENNICEKQIIYSTSS